MIPAGAPSPGVTIDGFAIPELALNAPRKVDPGHHVAIATVGATKSEAAFDLAPGETREVPLAYPVAVTNVAALTNVAAVAAEPAGESSSSRAPAYVAFGVGAAGIVVTTVFGIVAESKKSSLNAECGASRTQCPSSDVSARDQRDGFGHRARRRDRWGRGRRGVALLASQRRSAEAHDRSGLAVAGPGLGRVERDVLMRMLGTARVAAVLLGVLGGGAWLVGCSLVVGVGDYQSGGGARVDGGKVPDGRSPQPDGTGARDAGQADATPPMPQPCEALKKCCDTLPDAGTCLAIAAFQNEAECSNDLTALCTPGTPDTGAGGMDSGPGGGGDSGGGLDAGF